MHEMTLTVGNELVARYAPKIDFLNPGGCWIWRGKIGNHGYGMGSLSQKGMVAHRLIYEVLVGPIPDGMVLDHVVCGNRLCVNPNHMEIVTRGENTRRAQIGRTRPFQPKCRRGHFAHWDEKTGQARCRTCARERQRQYRASKKG